MLNSSPVHWLLAVVFGAAMTVSYAPANAWWFAPCCLAAFLLLLQSRHDLRNALMGLGFGIGWFGTGTWWVGRGVLRYTDAGLALSAMIGATLVLYLALFAAAAAWACGRLLSNAPARTDWIQPLRIAAVWTLAEWARGHFLGGFPWMALGYAHTQGPLSGFAPVIGVYGVGFVNVFLAAWMAAWLTAYLARIAQPARTSKAARRLALQACILPGLLLCAWILTTLDWTRPVGILSVRLIQGNIAQDRKFSTDGLKYALESYFTSAAGTSAALTIMPETAFPIMWDALPDEVRDDMARIARQRQTTVLFGSVTNAAAGQPGHYANSALAMGAEGQVTYRYDKSHLVPVGEFLPQGLSWMGPKLSLHFGAFDAGTANPAPLRVGAAAIALSICYEDLFGEALAERAASANLLVNLSNFAWFNGTWAPAQHLQVAQMRALETGRGVLRAANTGVTAVIDAHGRVAQSLEPETSDVLDAEVELRDGLTPYMRWGDLPVLGVALLICILRFVHPARRPPA